MGHCGLRPRGHLWQDQRENSRAEGAAPPYPPFPALPQALFYKKSPRNKFSPWETQVCWAGCSLHIIMLSSSSLGILPTAELQGAWPGTLDTVCPRSPFCPREVTLAQAFLDGQVREGSKWELLHLPFGGNRYDSFPFTPSPHPQCSLIRAGGLINHSPSLACDSG